MTVQGPGFRVGVSQQHSIASHHDGNKSRRHPPQTKRGGGAEQRRKVQPRPGVAVSAARGGRRTVRGPKTRGEGEAGGMADRRTPRGSHDPAAKTEERALGGGGWSVLPRSKGPTGGQGPARRHPSSSSGVTCGPTFSPPPPFPPAPGTRRRWRQGSRRGVRGRRVGGARGIATAASPPPPPPPPATPAVRPGDAKGPPHRRQHASAAA